MEGSEAKWVWVRRQAARYVRGDNTRLGNGLSRDDLVQEVVLATWLWAARPHDPERLWAAVRTIAVRRRGRALTAARRQQWLVYTSFDDAEPAAVLRGDRACLRIGGRAVPLAWATARLPALLARLSALDRHLLLGFHEGFCCAELAHRYGRSEDCVKTRIHRARRRLRTEFEGIACAAGDLEEP